MASESQIASKARKSRTSIAILILSVASIYYSTQIYLNYTLNLWGLLIYRSMVVAGIILLIIGLFLLYQDYQYESEYKDLSEREKRADVLSKESEVEEIKADQAKAKQEEGQTANIVEEGGAL